MKRTAVISFASGIASVIFSVISFFPMAHVRGYNTLFRSPVNTILCVMGLLLATISVILGCTVAFNSKSKRVGRGAVILGAAAFIIAISATIVIMMSSGSDVNDTVMHLTEENAELAEQLENLNGGL